MKTKLKLVAFCLMFSASGLPAFAQGTAFTYQGRLTSAGTNYTGSAEFQPTLWDAASAGSAVATNAPVSVIVGVTNGLFVLPLDFGAAFGLGPDEKHIATVDADGVALAAIQGLNEKFESGKQKAEKAETQMTELQNENAELKARLEKLEQLLNLK